MALMLVDAANLYFRAFYAVPESVVAPDGRPVNAVRGFLDMAASLIERRRPHRWIACLDLEWRPAFRVALVPSYKAHRLARGGAEDVPARLVPQIPLLLGILTAAGLACSGAEGFEADDVMATLAARDTEPVEIVSGDRDLLATATERVTVLYTGRGLARMEAMGPEQVQARYGVPAANYADFAVLRGDPSDGLPGVPGIGEKTAAALVARFGSIEAILAATERGDGGFPAGAAAKVRAARAYLAKAPGAVRLRADAPVFEVDDALPHTPRDGDQLTRLAADLGVEPAVQRLQAAVRAALAATAQVPLRTE